uniref:Neural-cadherin n=1 Tax=Schistocephalus solidus TaxID=70667 RepID=A0A0X3PH08_SCHSO
MTLLLLLGIFKISFLCNAQKPEKIFLNIPETQKESFFNIPYQLNLNKAWCRIYNQSEENVFQINPPDCVLKLRPGASLDYERTKKYFIYVSINSADYSKRAPYLLQFQINVLDVNDEPPRFKPPWENYPDSQAKAVLVNGISTPPGTRVFQVEAIDPDVTADLVYSWTPGREVDTQGRFYISPTSGVITTVGAESFPVMHVYRLSIRVVDKNSDLPTKSFADMRLLVYTAFQPVQFPLPVFTFNFSEGQPTGSEIGRIPAHALNYAYDSVFFTLLRVPAASEAPVELIDGATGSLKTTRTLDYERLIDHSWPYLVQATENNSHTATALMVVTLVDVDDNPPFFQLAEYDSNIIREDVRNNTPVMEVMPDDKDVAPANRRYTYSLSGQGAANFYVENTESGAAQIRTKRPLRYDTLPQGRPFYELTLHAKSPPGAATTQVRIRIQNVNRHPPELNPIPPLQIFRDIAKTSAFVQVSASDPDGSPMQFFFVDSASNKLVGVLGPFKLDATTGNVYLNSEPELKVYSLLVCAEDDGSCPGCPVSSQKLRSQPMTLQVEVVDRNAHAPTFSDCPHKMNIMELAPAGTKIGQVSAIDEDDVELSKTLIKYSLIGNTVFSTPTRYLKIDASTGVITNVVPLVRAAGFYGGILPDELYFTVKATDWGVPEYWNLCNFQLNIIDINNHAPVFDPANYVLVVEANHDFGKRLEAGIGHVVAIDLDQQDTENAEIIYRINPPVPHFTVDSKSGVITVSGVLTETRYDFTVEAKNPVELVGTTRQWQSATVTVKTTSNSSLLPPQLKIDSYIPGFKENQLHFPVAEVTSFPAAGADYSLSLEQFPGAFEQTGWSNSPPPFTSELVQGTNGVTLRVLSGSNFLYQRLNRYIIRIRACSKPTDAEMGDICTDLVLNFQLEDVNNMVPQFIDLWLLNQISIPENSPKGTEVLRMFAVDSDTVPAYREVTYSLVQTTDAPKFIIQDAVLRTNTEDLDHEKKNTYVVQISAKDGAPSSFGTGEPNSVETSLTIHILDMNDNPPVFESPSYVFNVSETAPIGHKVGLIHADDADDTSMLVYLLPGIVLDFAVNSVTGEITVARRLDYAAQDVHNFKVEVTDGQTSSSTDVTVYVMKSNQNLPKFSQALYQYIIQEETTATLTPSPTATDPNDKPRITYSLGGAFASNFEINPSTGSLKVIKGLNRDKPLGLPVYMVSVIATNAVDASYAVVRVNLTDVNDEYPRWPYPKQTIALPENTPANTPFARLAAPDADIGQNAQSTYISSPAHDEFQVSTIGDITALKSYDYEYEGSRRFYLPINAINIQPAFQNPVFYSATGSLTVTLLDVNDGAPVLIDGPLYDVSVPESSPVGVDVFTFLISDPDVSDQGLFECVLTESNAYFDVTFLDSIEACGVRPKMKLDLQATPPVPPAVQALSVVVYDSGRLHSALATVKITVMEDNDRVPRVLTSQIDHLVDGTVGPIRLSHLQASSEEAAETSFTFQLESRSSACGMFGLTSITQNSAQLTLIGRLDRETLQALLAEPNSYENNPNPASVTDSPLRWPLVLTVSDQREPALSMTTTLTLTVRTRGPLIPPASLTGLTVPNKAPVGTDVQPIDISATDLDAPNQGDLITYSIAPQPPQAARLFSLIPGPPGSFRLKTKVSLDRDAEGTATVLVPVIAVGVYSRSATSTLTVTITDSSAPNPDSPAVGKVEVYIPEAWPWPYLNAVPQLPIAYMPLNERYPTDRSLRTFTLQPEKEEDLMFSVYSQGLLYLKSASPPGQTTVLASVSTKGQSGSTSSKLDVTVRWMDGSALLNGLVFRVNKATADWFVKAPDPTNPEVHSPRDRVVAAMVKEIDVPAASITMFPLQTVGTSFDVFVGVHGSPYQVPGRLVYSLTINSQAYNTALKGTETALPVELATQVYGTSGPLVFACSSEAAAMAACGGRGCRNHLRLTAPPPPTDTQVTPANNGLTLLTPDGTAVGPRILPGIGCWCNGADPIPVSIQPVNCSDPQACLNGGACRSEPGTQTVSCICPSGYSGPRCEQTEVYFSSKGFAWTPSIGSCAQLHISFLLSTTTNQPALLLYAGPLQGDTSGDFLGLQILDTSGLQLKVAYNLGSGVVEGVVTLPTAAKLTDGNWHRVDIFLLQELAAAELTIMVDMCKHSTGAGQANGFPQPPNLDDCIFKFPYKNGLNRALNVGQYPLQLGGLWNPTGTTRRTSALTSESFLGSIRQVIVNGELWNLAQFGTGQNALPRHPGCTDSSGADRCAPNGVCRGQGEGLSQTTVCQCRRGFRRVDSDKCTPSEDSVEVGPAPSYIQLTAKAALPSSPSTEKLLARGEIAGLARQSLRQPGRL